MPRRILSLFRNLFCKHTVEQELDDELGSSVDIMTEEKMRDGISRSAARRQALIELGGVEQVKEEVRAIRAGRLLEDFIGDLRLGLRTLAKSPGFTAVAVLSLALGIGANTAIFSVVNLFLLRPLPFPQPERLAVLFERNVIGNEQRMAVAPGNFLDWQKTSTRFEHISAQATFTAILSSEGPGRPPERLAACACSASLFSALGVSPAVGRSFLPEEDRNGARRVAVISHNLWQRQFGGSPGVSGRAIQLDGELYEVVGVMPRGFLYPNRNVDAWIPFLNWLQPQLQVRHDLHFLRVIGRLRPGVSLEQGAAEIDAIAARYKNAHPGEATGRGAAVVPLHSELVQDVRRPLLILLGAVSCVLLIACLNIASLMLTRATARTREIGVRAALGASRGRIIRQLTTESILLALAGGVAGAVLAIAIARILVAHAPGAAAILPSGYVPVEPVMFLFAFALAVVVGIGVGFFPALRASRTDLVNDLKDSSRSATTSRRQGRLRNAVVAAEVALSLVLLVAAGLLLRSVARLYEVEPGIRLDGLLTMSVSLPGARYREPSQRSAFLDQLGQRLQTVPGIRSAGMVSCVPLTGNCNALFFYIEGRPYVPGKFFVALERSADPGYFVTAGIPLLRGRTFSRRDGVGFDAKHPRPGAVVISESMAKTFFPNEDPIGKRIFFDFEVQRERLQGLPAPRHEVIGIVGDVLPTLDGTVTPTLYRPALDVANSAVSVLLHTAVDPRSAATAAQNEMRKLEPGLAIHQVQTMEELLGRSTSDRRFSMLLFAAFAGVAIVLAAVGLYGVVSYAVSHRTAEIGIRMALGATASDVKTLMLLEGLKPAIAGVALGLVGATFASRMLRSQLFHIAPFDTVTFSLVPLMLLAVAALACYIPATRATRLGAALALRAE